jgi:hypothetical protein
VKDLLARYRALVRWVELERARLERTGDRPTQRYLRRARLVLEIDEVTFRELARELDGISRPHSSR